MCNFKWVIRYSLIEKVTLEQRPGTGKLPVLTHHWLSGVAGKVTSFLWVFLENNPIRGLT